MKKKKKKTTRKKKKAPWLKAKMMKTTLLWVTLKRKKCTVGVHKTPISSTNMLSKCVK
jgi:hypothetical protein